MASTRDPAFVAPSALIPLDKRPLKELFTLPDLTPVEVEEAESGSIAIRVGQAPAAKQDGSHARFPAPKEAQAEGLQNASLSLALLPLTDEPKVSVSHGQVNEDRRVKESVWQINISQSADGTPSFSDVWAAIYALWVRKDQFERFPVRLGSSWQNADNVKRFLLQTGLALYRVDDDKDRETLLLDRSAFWQGAGAPLARSWLQNPALSTEFGPLSSTVFPLTQSFTRSTDPPVLATHPLRPPKPAPGTIVYSRYVHSVKQHFQLTIIDWRNEEQFGFYSKWQNSDRVNVGWRERGDDEHHRSFLKGREADTHTMGLISSWDGEYAGYSEASWTKEDGASAFVGGGAAIGDYDQGTHSLVGEERFRGRHRFAHNMISLKHFCFLREPRSEIVIGEPRYDLSIIPLLAAYLPQSHRKEIELPHKRSVLYVLHRDRFFSEAIFY